MNLKAILSIAVVFTVATASAQITTYLSKFDQEAIEEAYVGSGVVFSTDTFGTAGGNRGVFTSFTGASTNISYTSTGSPQIQINDQYGGNGEGNYLGIASGATVTATFATPVRYFGLYITALDANNRVQLYSGTTLLLDFTAATLTALLPNNPTSTIRAIDGTLYNTNQYYGQPVTNVNPTEPYAYVSFFASAGTTISKAILSEPANTAILETDNYSINTAAVTPASSLVQVTVPEPGVVACFILGGLLLAGTRFRRRSA